MPLGKADRGDFSQNDALIMAMRQALDYWIPGEAPADPRGQNTSSAARREQPIRRLDPVRIDLAALMGKQEPPQAPQADPLALGQPQPALPPGWASESVQGVSVEPGGAMDADPGMPMPPRGRRPDLPERNPAFHTTDDLLFGAPAMDEGETATTADILQRQDPPPAARGAELSWLENLSPIDRQKLEIEIFNAQKLTEEQKAANAAKTKEDILSMLPVVGNVMSAEMMFDQGNQAKEALQAGNYKDAGVAGMLAALGGVGSVMGNPLGKVAGDVAEGASSRAGVFVPALDDAAADRARDMRQSGKSNQDVWKDTKKLFGADGKLREEIFDQPMSVTGLAGLDPYTSVPLREIMTHPALSERAPWVDDILVRGAGNMPNGAPVKTARTDAAGNFVMPSNEGAAASNLAKLLQYRIADESGFAPAMRHDVGSMRQDIAGSANKAASARYESPQDIAALSAYMNEIQEMMRLLEETSGSKFGSNFVTARSAGNVDAKKAQMRADVDPSRLEGSYPYSRNQAFAGKQGADRPAAFEDQVPLLRKDASPEEVRQALMDWYLLGSGRDEGIMTTAMLLAKGFR